MAVVGGRSRSDCALMASRTAGAFIFGAFVGGWLARALFKWLLGMSGTWTIVLILATAVGGGLVCAVGTMKERT
jgi:hypothetical protein